jgi:hypothetical protein
MNSFTDSITTFESEMYNRDDNSAVNEQIECDDGAKIADSLASAISDRRHPRSVYLIGQLPALRAYSYTVCSL